MRVVLAGVCAAVLFAMPALAGGLSASYDVEGTSPGGGGDYKGTVSVKQTGDATYQVVWLIGNDKFVGTGIGSLEGLAVGYKSGSNTGIAIYSQKKDGTIEGYWTYAGGKQVGEEHWTPR